MKEKKKNRKLTEGEGFSLSQRGLLEVSLGALFGAENMAKADVPEEGDMKPEKILPEAAREKAAGEAKLSWVSLRRERAGRGGKTVTIVTLPQDYCGDRAALAKELRKGLGCGSTMEEEKIVLQGDIMERVEGWFVKKGAAKITKSG